MKQIKYFGETYDAEEVSGCEDKPYLEYIITKRIKKYNPNYGDDKKCVCGHTYYRHFDSWQDMTPCGCKYCSCNIFKLAEE